jgi:hypothetical protein
MRTASAERRPSIDELRGLKMNEVGWIVDLDILPDQVDAFYALTLEMINAAHSEPGCLSYERFFTGDRRNVVYLSGMRVRRPRFITSEVSGRHLVHVTSKW